MPEFLQSDHAPIGFISFDLDYYTSAAAAFRVFADSDNSVLPLVIGHFDDVVCQAQQMHGDNIGKHHADDNSCIGLQ